VEDIAIMTRCRLFSHVCFVLLLGNAAALADDAPADPIPVTGDDVSQFAAAEAWLLEYMHTNQVPGASLAIAVDGELKLARGYGYADREAKEPVQPEALFRIASISKPVTAVAVLKLVDEGKLKLDDSVVDLLGLRPANEKPADYDLWWDRVTLQHLLTHSGGWDRDRSGDPMFLDVRIVKWLNRKLPLDHATLNEYQFRRPLDFAPGTRYAYSNFGYSLLGRAIEKASGEPYEKYVREQVFAPLGITSARIGSSLESERCEQEVNYYTVDGYKSLAVVGPDCNTRQVPGQYGGWNQRLLDSHGGWIMSSVDLVKFGLALEVIDDAPTTRGGLLKRESAQVMFSPQVALSGGDAKIPGYGYGWVVTRLDDRPIVLHNGALPCTASVLARLDDRVWFAVLLNLGRTADGKWLSSGLDRELGRRIHEALTAE
jgi:N-acyl-D-amino-acid deacylase